MGTTLTGLTPSTTYDALIKVGDNGPIDGTLKTLSDGLGNDLPVQASTTAVNFTATLTQSGTALQPVLVSGTSIKTVNSNSLLGAGDVAVQPTLVSGVSIKTVNSTSLLGSGDIPIPIVTPSGVSGAIQFSNGSAFASDAANFFWDNTNKRLGIGTNVPAYPLDIFSGGTYVAQFSNSVGKLGLGYDANGGFLIPLTALKGTYLYNNSGNSFIGVSGAGGVGVNTLTPSGAFHIKGSGSTSATTSLLVQTSAGLPSLQVLDSRSVRINGGSGNGLTLEVGGTLEATGSSYLRGQSYGFSGFFAGMNSGENASAIIQADSTTKGFLPPRMTTTQKNAIASPAAGLVLYDSTTNKLQCYNGSTWNDLF